LHDNSIEFEPKLLGNFSKIPLIFGVSIYAFEAIGIIFTVRASVINEEKDFPVIFKRVNIAICVLYIIFSVIGAVTFGQNINEIVLFSLPNSLEYAIF